LKKAKGEESECLVLAMGIILGILTRKGWPGKGDFYKASPPLSQVYMPK